jgi:hypothetical protein
MSTYTTSGITTFVLGQETDGNRENRDFKDAKSYDLDPTDSVAYGVSVASTEFPVI